MEGARVLAPDPPGRRVRRWARRRGATLLAMSLATLKAAPYPCGSRLALGMESEKGPMPTTTHVRGAVHTAAA